jgi:hypothetical protein
MFKYLLLLVQIFFGSEYIQTKKLGLQKIVYDPADVSVGNMFCNNRYHP